LDDENVLLRKTTSDLLAKIHKMESRVSILEGGSVTGKQDVRKEEKDDDDFDLFGGDNDEADDDEVERVKQARVEAYNAKKANKPVLIAKSSLVLDVKPWDDETDMTELERSVRSIEQDGLLWGASKLVPLAYGIKKLQISAVIEDDKVSVDELEEKITSFEDLIQSMDIAAFNKI